MAEEDLFAISNEHQKAKIEGRIVVKRYRDHGYYILASIGDRNVYLRKDGQFYRGCGDEGLYETRAIAEAMVTSYRARDFKDKTIMYKGAGTVYRRKEVYA